MYYYYYYYIDLVSIPGNLKFIIADLEYDEIESISISGSMDIIDSTIISTQVHF